MLAGESQFINGWQVSHWRFRMFVLWLHSCCAWCVSLTTGNQKVSDALTWSTCSHQKCNSVTCAWRALTKEGCHITAVTVGFNIGLGLIETCESQWGWFSQSAYSELPNVTSRAGTCHQCTSWSSTPARAGCETGVNPSSPTHFHLPSRSPDSGLMLPQPSPA